MILHQQISFYCKKPIALYELAGAYTPPDEDGLAAAQAMASSVMHRAPHLATNRNSVDLAHTILGTRIG